MASSLHNSVHKGRQHREEESMIPLKDYTFHTSPTDDQFHSQPLTSSIPKYPRPYSFTKKICILCLIISAALGLPILFFVLNAQTLANPASSESHPTLTPILARPSIAYNETIANAPAKQHIVHHQSEQEPLGINENLKVSNDTAKLVFQNARPRHWSA